MNGFTSLIIPASKQWILTTYDDKKYVLDEAEYKLVKQTIKRDIKFVDFGEMTLAVSDIRRIEEEQIKERTVYEFED